MRQTQQTKPTHTKSKGDKKRQSEWRAALIHSWSQACFSPSPLCVAAPAVAFLSGVLRVNGSFLSSILICIPSEKDSELRAVMVPFFRLEINK